MAKRGGWFRKRSTRYGTQMGLSVLIVLGILAGLEGIAMNHHWRVDLTENRRYSLAPQTLKILKGLDAPVKVYAFYQEGAPSRRAARDLLDLYTHQSERFGWEFVDPDRFPLKAKKYQVNTYNIMVLEQGDRVQRVLLADEGELTNALIKLTRRQKRVLYFLEGHGEHGLDNPEMDGYSRVKKAMEDEDYEVKPLILARERAVPEDADVVLVAGPQKALHEEEQQAIGAYVQRGGRLLIMVDPEAAPGMDTFLEQYGIALGQDMVVDMDSRLLGGDYLLPLIVQYGLHPITEDFRRRPYLAYLPMARSVRPSDNPPKGAAVEVLARTGPGSWGEVDIDRIRRGEAELNPGVDTEGPVPVAVVSTIRLDEIGKQARIVVFGDSDFVKNAAIDPNRSANQDLFLNALNWLTEQEDLISIRAKSAISRPVVLRPGQRALIFLLVVVAFPLAILAVGLGVLWRRRSNR